MAIVTAVANICQGGDHADVTTTIQGETFTLDRERLGGDLRTALSALERRQFAYLACRVLFQSGVPLSKFLNRVLLGQEATSVQTYPLVGPGAAILRSNAGTTYGNALPGINGQRQFVDFTGKTEFRIMLNVNFGQTGHSLRIVRHSDSAVLYERSPIALTGDQELDTGADAAAVNGWLPLPSWSLTTEGNFVRLEHKAPAGTTAMTVRNCELALR